MTGLLALDAGSQLGRLDAAATLGALQEELRPRGLTLGPVPVESRARTLGQALCAPRPSEATPRGRLVDRCAALDATLADGTALSTRLAPRKAVGPDVTAALLATGGGGERIEAAWMRLARIAEHRRCLAFAFEADGGGDGGGAALERALALLAGGVLPVDLAVVDGALLAPLTSGAGAVAGTVVLLLRLEGPPALVGAEAAAATELLAAGRGGGRPLDDGAAAGFLLHRQPLALAEVMVVGAALSAVWRGRRGPSLLRGQLPERAAFSAAPADLPPPHPRDVGAIALLARLRAELGA